jgi:hypothetical protein
MPSQQAQQKKCWIDSTIDREYGDHIEAGLIYLSPYHYGAY